MSFWSRLFTRNLTYLEVLIRDGNYDDLLHVFGAIRIMPEDGDSFDIWRHAVIDLTTYRVTNGLQQRGNEFSLKSPFAQRCLEHMSGLLNRNLKPETKKDYSDTEDEPPPEEFSDLETNCEFPVLDLDQNDTDTAEPKRMPKDGLVFTKNNFTSNGRFSVQLFRHGAGLQTHSFNGDHAFFRHILWLKKTNRILITYRKENWAGSGGGMGFFVLDAITGALLHNDLIK